MSSFRNVLQYQNKINTSVSSGKPFFYKHFLHRMSLLSVKRMSYLFFFCHRSYRAGMTVEASLTVPFFLFFLMNILFSFDALCLHGNVTVALHQTGNQMCFYSYAYGLSEWGEAIPKEVSSLVLSEVYVKNKVLSYLGKEYLDHSCMMDGSGGLHFYQSSIMKEEDIIELVVSYQAEPTVGILSFIPLFMENRYYGRAWTGYDVEHRNTEGSSEDLLVYITESGEAYHMSRACSYLNPSIHAAPLLGMDQQRNKDGERYAPCPSCYREGLQVLGYITDYGNRVHTSLQCSGLKRTVYAIRLSETAGKRRCSKCG